MREPIPLPLDSKYHMFCFLTIKQSRDCTLSWNLCPDIEDRYLFKMIRGKHERVCLLVTEKKHPN